jgi:hypothetical protein
MLHHSELAGKKSSLIRTLEQIAVPSNRTCRRRSLTASPRSKGRSEERPSGDGLPSAATKAAKGKVGAKSRPSFLPQFFLALAPLHPDRLSYFTMTQVG